jgi:dTDP-4-dehydrorhamnose 3,5-epimerase
MERFVFRDTPIAGLQVLEHRTTGDARGWFRRLFCAQDLAGLLGGRPIVQVNHTLTRAARTVRGLHFQHPPYAEAKFVTCLRGKVFDVGVDLRRGSRTFLKWHAEVLEGGSSPTMYIPEGFAHGFQALTDDCELLYFHTCAYEPAAEGGIDALDPRLGIAWPLPVGDRSARDHAHPLLTDSFTGVSV